MSNHQEARIFRMQVHNISLVSISLYEPLALALVPDPLPDGGHQLPRAWAPLLPLVLAPDVERTGEQVGRHLALAGGVQVN